MEGPSKNSNSNSNSIVEFFGPLKRRPLKSNTLLRLSRIYSLFPDHNPFANYPSFAQSKASEPRCCCIATNDLERPRSGDLGDEVASTSEKEASGRSVGPHSEANSSGNAVSLGEDEGVNGLETIIHGSGRRNETVIVDAVASDDGEPSDDNTKVHDVPEDLLGIERILMDESDDLGQLQLPDEDVNFDIFNDFGSFFDTDVIGKESVPVESNGSGELHVGGDVKESLVGERESKDMEEKGLSMGGDVAASHALVSVDRDLSNCSKTVDRFPAACSEEVRGKKRKHCEEKVSHDLSQAEGFTFSVQRTKNEGVGGVCISNEKVSKSGIVTKGKSKKDKKATTKEVKPRKSKQTSRDVEASSMMKDSGPMVHGKMLKQNLLGKGNSPTGKVVKHRPESQENIRYTREQLLHLKRMSVAPDDVLKAIREAAAELLGKDQKFSAGKSMEGAGFSKMIQPGAPSMAKKAEEEGSGILKSKKRGTSSEARKEKKKKKRREKRAEMNRKLGVKRLKLKPPVSKPKVVPPCRHYMLGRCQEGEKCKFSHDVIPLTKSKPCCHFARQACMKGDDCPFDHQLSKYPCNNYATTGFCSRGDGCSFSHKIQDKEGLEPKTGLSREVKCADQLDKLNFKTQHGSIISSSLGIGSPSKPKENSAVKTGQPAKAPKGLSFLSFGRSEPDDSGNRKEILQQSKTLMGSVASTEPVGTIPVASGETSVNSCTKTPTGINFLSLSAPSHSNSANKVQPNLSDNGRTDSRISVSDKGIVNASYKLKAIQPRTSSSPSSSGQKSISVNGTVKGTSSSAQKTLLSTLAFASKFGSGIKTSSVGTAKEANKNEAMSSGSAFSRQNEPPKASAILDFLYGVGNKQKQ